jgi:hypothetical protein
MCCYGYDPARTFNLKGELIGRPGVVQLNQYLLCCFSRRVDEFLLTGASPLRLVR